MSEMPICCGIIHLMAVEEESSTTGASISSGASLFSHFLEEMIHVIQTTDEGQLQCLVIEFTLPPCRSMSMMAFSNDHHVRLKFTTFMELEQQMIIRLVDREHAEPRDIQARLSAQFGDTTYSLRSVQRWGQYIQQGHELVDDGQWGRICAALLSFVLNQYIRRLIDEHVHG
jgi:hypothetical protein